MSSKHRKHHGRGHRGSRHSSSPTGRHGSGQPARQNRGKGGSGRTFVRALVAVVVVGALAWLGYAAFGPKRGEPAQAGAAGTQTTNAGQPALPAAPSVSNAPPVDPNAPRIEFASRTYDFGRADGDTLVDCLFVFTNTGKARLELSEVRSSCSCLKLGEWTRQVEPGATGTIPVRLDTRLYTGRFAKSLYVTCNDPAQAKPILQVAGNVWRPFEITPVNAVLNLSTEVPSNSATIRIVSHLEEPVTLTALATTGVPIAAELQTNQPGKEYQLNIHSVPPVPVTSRQGEIKLQTSATNQAEITIKVHLNVQPVVSVVPLQLRLPPLPLAKPYTGTVWVRNNGTNTLVVSEGAVDAAPAVEVQLKENEPGRMWIATLNFPAGFNLAAGQSIAVRLKTNHPDHPLLSVPIMSPPGAAATGQ